MADWVFDTDKVTVEDYRKIAESQMFDRVGDDVLAKSAGIALEAVQAMSVKEYRRFVRAFFKACSDPLADPN